MIENDDAAITSAAGATGNTSNSYDDERVSLTDAYRPAQEAMKQLKGEQVWPFTIFGYAASHPNSYSLFSSVDPEDETGR